MTDAPDRWSKAAPELRQFWDMLDYDAVHILGRLNDEDYANARIDNPTWLRRKDALQVLRSAFAKKGNRES